MERIVTTRIDDDETEARLDLRHPVQQPPQIQAVIDDVSLLVGLQVSGDQVVGTPDLHSVAGEIDHADRVGGELPQEFLDGIVHDAAGGVLTINRLEAPTLQLPPHRARVGDRVTQHRRILIVVVADNQCDPRLPALAARGCGAARIGNHHRQTDEYRETQEPYRSCTAGRRGQQAEPILERRAHR